MAILSKTYLATHPKGSEKAEFTISTIDPELPENPDGGPQRISITFIADTWMLALQAATNILTTEQYREGMAEAYIEQYAAEFGLPLQNKGDSQALITHARHMAQGAQWNTEVSELTLTHTKDGEDVETQAMMKIHAPNAAYAGKGLVAIGELVESGQISLQAIAVDVCTNALQDQYDEDDHAGSVLVVD